MAGWSGFSDEDLRKMKKPSPDEDELNKQNARRQAMARKAKVSQQRERVGRQMSNPTSRTAGQAAGEPTAVDPAMKLSSSGKIANSKYPAQAKERFTDTESHGTKDRKMTAADRPADEGSPESKVEPAALVADVKELNEEEALNAELGNVHKFQQQQKVIEEANKHKRALLAKAIEDRRKKAKAEADKLMKVQRELNHLDSLLTADVSIIRDKIEVASLEYMDAQKRYEKAEKEFVAAKMDFFEKGETKEQLTEHLYTIIHQNEVRKAKKLVELMEKLTMEVTPEEMELTIPSIPQLTNFTAVATLQDPHRPKRSSVSEDQNQQPQSPGVKKAGESVAGDAKQIEESSSSAVDNGVKDLDVKRGEAVSNPPGDVPGTVAGTIAQQPDPAQSVATEVSSSNERTLPPSTDGSSAPVADSNQVAGTIEQPLTTSSTPSTNHAQTPQVQLCDQTNSSLPSDQLASQQNHSSDLANSNSLNLLDISTAKDTSQDTNFGGVAKPDQNGNVSSHDEKSISTASPSTPSQNANAGQGWKLPFS